MHGLFPFPFIPFLSFHIIFLLTSTGQTGEPFSMVASSNDVFPPKEVPFLDLIEKICIYHGPQRAPPDRQPA
jgi:hypothetical protein